MGIKNQIIKTCASLGIDSIGFIKCRRFDELESFYKERKILNLQNEFEEDDVEKRINPNQYLEEGKTIISIAFPYLTSKINTNNGFSLYTKGMDYHYVIGKYLKIICEIIEYHGGKAKGFVDSNALPERYIAYLAGNGFIGKNNLLINKKYGSYIFLGEIITDLEIYDDDNGSLDDLNSFKECGECNKCYVACPTKAINANKKNCNICLSYITQKKELQDWEMEKLQGRMFGCDTCQLVCPYNIEKELSKIPEFLPFDFMNSDDNDFVINMGNTQFKETFKNTSCGWRGKNVLKRNALIRRKIYLKNDDLSKIPKFESPYLNGYINRLFQKTRI
ncbi:tRNA epoxyqueuosine(34) reductase QueG [Clostridium taeniosporum]|uniref:tRNA epoxyqueuosine(34) reductase QueG n=1 Tax=Clostridium taeniosporum TaxID=394958 RepID=A0A1D7XM68_9CLOT|nr:tRNA epoxyqueuosine(34) reductase QueG [Clostridium taeniosporum]AOR24431.1 tRNA epoxyqueuosine(34) reductase QueG [Clostridium taeniosporum]